MTGFFRTYVLRPLIVLVVGAVFLWASLSPSTFTPHKEFKNTFDFKTVTFEQRDRLYGAASGGGGSLWLVGKFGKILHSDDHGESWTRQYVEFDKEFLDVIAWDARRALVIGEDGTLLRTQDGGKTWVELDSPYTSKTKFQALMRAETGQGGRGWVVGQSNLIIRSDDYGKTWSRVTPAGRNTWYDIAIPEPGKFVSVGEFGRISVGTRTSGDTWIMQETRSPEIGAQSLKAVRFLDANRGLAVGLDGLILRSTDGGVNWTTVHEKGGKGDHIFAVHHNGENWMATGAGGWLYRADSDASQWKVNRIDPDEFGWYVTMIPGSSGTFFVGDKLGYLDGNGHWILHRDAPESFPGEDEYG